ncbi:uncharacterized protein I303_105082 [Kwoniella dejecticola CBS 10117]|uniref:Atos-like conserved domain-containing protein n=1 Tax=Kwoniella dejecticola CBS 10117 TaxID=1296121 RepID=A0A1A6A3I2_9TREE|nr:uncharacterized protein I303_05472 [Kwoniella dejecticola CBS 10117]OBR84613.1 hypothetical protein I303_05472 [Kwoniella dejecticola CBS 10117]
MTYIQSNSPLATPSSSTSPSPSASASFSSSYSYKSSPIRHSPLSQPPIVAGPSRTPSPAFYHHHIHIGNGTRPIPTPTSRISRRPSLSPLSSITSPSPPAHFSRSGNQHSPATPQRQSNQHDEAHTPSPPLSRSHPLLGSYHLSLLHSRMSHAHQPHELSNEFSLSLMSVGKGRSCPRELKFPKALEIPFSATYYDLFNPDAPSSPPSKPSFSVSSSPWTGNVNIETHYYTQFSSYVPRNPLHPDTSSMTTTPPSFPGYQVAPTGQLQILVKSSNSPIKVFLIPYDLRKVPLGGRLLIREKTYCRNSSQAQGNDELSKSKLKYAIQLQFVCVSANNMPDHRSREDDNPFTTRNQRISKSFVNSERLGKAYYISKSLKLVFVTAPPEKDEVLEIERKDEIVDPPSIEIETAPGGEEVLHSKRRKSSFAFSPGSLGKTSDDWIIHRSKWLSRQALYADRSSEEEEEDRVNPPDSPKIVDLNVMGNNDSEIDSSSVSARARYERSSRVSTTSPVPAPAPAPGPPPSVGLPSSEYQPSSPSLPLPSLRTTAKAILSPIPILSPLPIRSGAINHSRPITPTPTSPRSISPHIGNDHGPPLIWSPKSQRRMRREDGLEEVELSERLRRMKTHDGQA